MSTDFARRLISEAYAAYKEALRRAQARPRTEREVAGYIDAALAWVELRRRYPVYAAAVEQGR